MAGSQGIQSETAPSVIANLIYLVVSSSNHLFCWYPSPLPIRAYPELRVNFVFWYYFTPENVPHYKIVVHRVSDDLGHGRGIEFEETVMFRLSRLRRRGHVTIKTRG